jgi:glycosyltransferase involved in cell wall biosynthesis
MLSIITPVYNGEKFISGCIENVINQQCPNIEHIIMDGGSTDKTVEIIRHYATQYSHIRWQSEKDRGQSDAMNKGIKIAKGDILGILNVDDYYEPGILCRIIELFKELPEPSFLVGNCNNWDDNGKLIEVNKPSKLKLTDLLIGVYVNPHPANPSAYFYHKSLHQEIGLYDINEHYAMDLDFVFRAVQVATVKYVNETWGNYRKLKDTKTITHCTTVKEGLQAGDLVREAYIDELPLAQRIRVTFLKSLYQHLRQARFKLRSSVRAFLPHSVIVMIKS